MLLRSKHGFVGSHCPAFLTVSQLIMSHSEGLVRTPEFLGLGFTYLQEVSQSS